MIGRLEGSLRQKTPTRALLDVGGVGYELWIPLSTFTALPDEGKVIALRVHTHVREDALQLFGFLTQREREVFELLLLASRVGPKLALTVLSGIEADELVEAIQAGKVAVLQSIPGIGRRMAERLVVELRDRVAELALPSAPTSARPGPGPGAHEALFEQIVSALANLGIPRGQAERAARRSLDELGGGASIESLIRSALRGVSR